jgi:hypothetical protein
MSTLVNAEVLSVDLTYLLGDDKNVGLIEELIVDVHSPRIFTDAIRFKLLRSTISGDNSDRLKNRFVEFSGEYGVQSAVSAMTLAGYRLREVGVLLREMGTEMSIREFRVLNRLVDYTRRLGRDCYLPQQICQIESQFRYFYACARIPLSEGFANAWEPEPRTVAMKGRLLMSESRVCDSGWLIRHPELGIKFVQPFSAFQAERFGSRRVGELE